jgi:soluble lytic murein transglycosylase-like protein
MQRFEKRFEEFAVDRGNGERLSPVHQTVEDIQMRLNVHTKRAACAAALLAVTALLACPLSAMAIAEEETGSDLGSFNALTAISEPIQISEALGPAYRPSNAFQKQVGLVSSYIATRNRALSPDEINSIAQAIVDYSNRYGIDYRLLTSLISVESSFRRNAVSPSGAIGMGQLKPDTAKWLGVLDPYDPVDNIAGTARFLAWLVRKYNGNLEAALSAYYQGPGFVDRNGVTDVCMQYLEKINRALIGLI